MTSRGSSSEGEILKVHVGTLAWELWNERCPDHQNNKLNSKSNFERGMNLTKDTWGTKERKDRDKHRRGNPHQDGCWVLLALGIVKLNYNGTWDSTSRKGRTRIITRDSNDNMLDGR